MKIVEIEALANGAHRNQEGAFETVPSGWAVIPDDMEIPDTFPFVNIETAEVEHTKESMIPDGEPETYTVVTVTKITAGIVPEPEKPTPAKQRENAYDTQAIIEWDGEMLTVTKASQKWQYYAAEGNTAKTDELTALIAEAKAKIREQYPDENTEAST